MVPIQLHSRTARSKTHNILRDLIDRSWTPVRTFFQVSMSMHLTQCPSFTEECYENPNKLIQRSVRTDKAGAVDIGLRLGAVNVRRGSGAIFCCAPRASVKSLWPGKHGQAGGTWREPVVKWPNVWPPFGSLTPGFPSFESSYVGRLPSYPFVG